MKLFQFLVAAMLLISSAIILADKPDPVANPPLQVREANTVDGWIAVHEQGTAKVEVQGTADVNVTGGSLNATITGGQVEVTNTVQVEGTVTVDNLKDEQAVFVNAGKLSPVNRYYSDRWALDAKEGGEHLFENGPIYATTIHVSGIDDEYKVTFTSGLFSTGDSVAFLFFDANGVVPFATASFMYPIPLDGLEVACLNESRPCHITITVHGFNPE